MFLVSSFYHQFGGKFKREKYSNKLYSNLLLEATPKFGNYDSYVISGIYYRVKGMIIMPRRSFSSNEFVEKTK